MNNSYVLFSKGQIKIQQMAIVLVGFAIFFALVSVFFFSFNLSSVEDAALAARQAQAQQRVLALAGSPEFSWTLDDCASCVDLDKVIALKNATYRSGLWGSTIALVQIRQLYPVASERECTSTTYPACSTTTLYRDSAPYTSEEAFVALCRYDAEQGKQCVLGKLLLGVKSP